MTVAFPLLFSGKGELACHGRTVSCFCVACVCEKFLFPFVADVLASWHYYAEFVGQGEFVCGMLLSGIDG